jgi:2-methylcitrate dehydratase
MEEYQTRKMARFIVNSRYEDIPSNIVEQLKIHLLDALASLIHAKDQPVTGKLMQQIREIGEGGPCRAPGVKALPADRAAQLFTALIRYPDFMDNFLGKEATCHPSDNIGALLAACQLGANTRSGKEFLLCMAIGYELECRLVEEFPVMIKGFDHTMLLAYSVTGALCKMLGLTEGQTAHALSIAGCSCNPLVVSRASYTYEWKGLASSLVALACMNIVFLAKNDVTGPLSLFEGPKGVKDIFNLDLDYDWSKEDFSLIRKCVLKSYNAEVHTQSAIEAILELRTREKISIGDIERIDVTTFLTAFHITGGGAYGDRKHVHSKEQADHSLPYVLAVALLDGEVYPGQFSPDRIEREDVQQLLGKINVRTVSPIHKPLILAGLIDPYTTVYPRELPAKVSICRKNKRPVSVEKRDYKGFFTRPFSWADVEEKFGKLASRVLSDAVRDRICSTVRSLEDASMADLIALL